MQASKILLALVLMMGLSMQAADPGESIAIVSMAGKPIVSANLNGKEAFFLLDTGSDLSIMNTQSAHGYRYAVRELPDIWAIHSINLNGETRRMQAVDSAKLFLGQTRIRTRWYGTDISALARSIRKKTGIEIVGIIGSDVMKKYGFQIDFASQVVHFQEPGTAKDPDAPAGRAHPQPSPELVKGR